MAAEAFAFRPATAADARWLAPRLRAADRAEVLATHDHLELALAAAIAASAICDVALLDDKPVFVIGCCPTTDPRVGCPWLLGTDTATRFPGALTGATRRYVAGFKERWPVLFNYVHARNTVSVRWLERLGFRICEAVPLDPKGELFHPFVMGA